LAGVRAVATSAELREATAAARNEPSEVGFVPTMGALHAGHRALLAAARRETGFVVASVFVNPLQFGPAEDLATYPRDREGDLAVLEGEGADLAFLPDEREVWPEPPEVRLHVGALGDRLEGASRPGHLDGVVTVVAKLLHLVGPSRAYFGQKDAQQLAVVRRMVADLGFPNEVVACPTVREPDGLAVSSRNAYLTPEERAAAPVLYRALRAGAAAVIAGERDPAAVADLVGSIVEAEPLATLVSSDVVDSATLVPPPALTGSIRLLVAARFGWGRLIDNIGVRVP
jgi:pantoate--beta-alanine ligase